MSDLIDGHLAALRAEGLATTTVRGRELVLRALDRQLPRGVDEASTRELQTWLGRAGLSTKTRETYWCHIVGFYRWASTGNDAEMDWDPSASLRRPRPKRGLPRVASDAQLRRCLAEIDDPRVHRCIILAAGAGMRAGEIAQAKRDDLTEEEGVRIIGKGDRARVVPLLDDVWEEVRDSPPGPLILHEGQPVTAHWVTRTCAAAFDRIGEPRLSIHWFRGAFATRLRRRGVDTATIAKLLGHSSVATTQVYLAFEDADLTAAVRRLPRLTEPARRIVEPEPDGSRLGPTAGAA
jgi:integrase